MLKVYGIPQARPRRVLWALEEMGVAYENIPSKPRAPEVAALNGTGKVPVLVDDETVISDSVAILHYLTDKHGQFTHPAGSPERGRQDAITFGILDAIEGPLWMLGKHSFVLPEEHRVEAAKDSFRWEITRGFDWLAGVLGDGPFLMGDTMTVPDFIATHCGTWAENAKVPITQAPVKDYLDRMRARPVAAKVFAL
jgi:glutathione S-transferase